MQTGERKTERERLRKRERERERVSERVKLEKMKSRASMSGHVCCQAFRARPLPLRDDPDHPCVAYLVRSASFKLGALFRGAGPLAVTRVGERDQVE